MKMHHEEITVKVLVPDGYYIYGAIVDQLVIPLLNFTCDYNTISDVMTIKISIKKDMENDDN